MHALALCPCCQQPRSFGEAKEAILQFDALYPNTSSLENKSAKEALDSLIARNDLWACDECLSSTKAIKADLTLQNFRSSPRFAYWCTEHECKECQRSFLFRKTEKKYWFERLQFFVTSEPTACPECRKIIRHQKNTNQELSNLLHAGESGFTTIQLARIIEIYQELGIQDKAKYFTGVLKRIKPKKK